MEYDKARNEYYKTQRKPAKEEQSTYLLGMPAHTKINEDIFHYRAPWGSDMESGI